MYINRNILQDYPHYGYFYTVEVDESKPLDQQKEEKMIIFETVCDITESSHSWSRNFIWAKYAVYFPFNTDVDELNITLGNLFEADLYGMRVNGKVVGVFPSQLGGVTVYIQDTDV
ncbi:MAG: hypothetical protein UH850_00405 [Paludibacteraceae bacterium]|nr:hypothetical protein [Paludibacteraceae bacterium]